MGKREEWEQSHSDEEAVSFPSMSFCITLTLTTIVIFHILAKQSHY